MKTINITVTASGTITPAAGTRFAAGEDVKFLFTFSPAASTVGKTFEWVISDTLDEAPLMRKVQADFTVTDSANGVLYCIGDTDESLDWPSGNYVGVLRYVDSGGNQVLCKVIFPVDGNPLASGDAPDPADPSALLSVAVTISGNGLSVSPSSISGTGGTFVFTVDPTLAALSALTIAANSLTIGTGADAFSQTSFAANTFPARASTGSLEAKSITDAALTVLDDSTVSAMVDTLGGASSTGTGGLVRTTSPTLVTPTLGAATATSINGNTITSGTGTLTLGAGSTLATSATNSITLTSTGATNVTLPTSGTLVSSVTTGNGVSATNTAGALAFTLGAITPSSVSTTSVSATSVSATTYQINGGSGTGTLTAILTTDRDFAIQNATGTIPVIAGTLAVASGKTLTVSNTLTFTGTDGSSVAFGVGGTVLYDGGGLGTPSSGNLSNCSSYPAGNLTGLGTGVSPVLAVAIGSAGAIVVNGGALGTPSSGDLVNCTYNIGATDTTLTRTGAGDIAVEGNAIYRAGGTDVPVADGGTGLSSGTSGGIPYFSGTTTIASSAALAANALVIGGGAGVAPSTVTTGTGVVTALGVAVGSAGAVVVNGGALGTPSSGNLGGCTAYPGDSSLTTVGTVASGVWSATAISAANGGTGQNFSASTGLAAFTSGAASMRPAAVTTGTFSKTSNTTLENITSLSVNVTTGIKYRIEVYLPITSGTVAAYKVALSGTATWSALHVTAEHLDCTNKYSDTVENVTALASVMLPTIKASVTNWTCQIQGSGTASGTGTLTVQFAQDVSNGTASTVLAGALLIATPIA